MRKLKEILGDKDDVAALEGAIAKERDSFEAAGRAIEELEAAKRDAESFEIVKSIDAKLEREIWNRDRAERRLAELAPRLQAAHASRLRARIGHWRKTNAAAYAKLRAAMEAAGAAQAEAIKIREAASAEIGDYATIQNLPVVPYRGLLFPEFIAIWTSDLDRVFAAQAGRAPIAPAPKSVPKPVPTPPERSIGSSARAPLDGTRSAPAEKRVRKPLPQIEGGVRVIALKSGANINGEILVAGDITIVPAKDADPLVRSGNFDFAPPENPMPEVK